MFQVSATNWQWHGTELKASQHQTSIKIELLLYSNTRFCNGEKQFRKHYFVDFILRKCWCDYFDLSKHLELSCACSSFLTEPFFSIYFLCVLFGMKEHMKKVTRNISFDYSLFFLLISMFAYFVHSLSFNSERFGLLFYERHLVCYFGHENFFEKNTFSTSNTDSL